MTHHPCDTQTDFHTSSSPAKTWRSHLPLRRQQGLLVVVRCLLLFLLAITITAGTALGTRVSHAGQIPCAGIECSTPTPGAKASPKVILEELKAAAYKDLMSGRTAPDGLPVLLDALLRHNRQDEVRGRGDRSLQELYNDEWTLANSYAVDHHVFLNGFVSDEADKLLHTPNVNWFANANMEWLWRQLQILQQNSAKSIIPGLVLAGRIEPEAPPSEVGAALDGAITESGRDLQSEFRASSVEEDPADVTGACSFTPETPVTTSQGIKPIGHLRVGQRILAYNPTTGRMENEPTLHVWLNQDDDLVDLTLRTAASIANGKKVKAADELIHTTRKHPFLTREKGFVPAGELSTGMHVQRADGSLGLLTGWKLVPGVKTMYNLEVEQDHTFTVGRGQWIVHNCEEGQTVRYTVKERRNGVEVEIEKWAYVGKASPQMKASLASDIARIKSGTRISAYSNDGMAEHPS